MTAAPALAQDNTSNLTQTGSSNTATVGQPGSSNDSNVTQAGSNSKATLNQSGTGNTSEIVQATLDTPMSPSSEATVNRTSSRTATRTTPSTTNGSDWRGRGGSDQLRRRRSPEGGQRHAYSNIVQNGTGAWAEVDQGGINNSSDIRQGNDLKRSGDRAFVDQSGDDNVSTVKQSTDDVGRCQPGVWGANTVNYSIVNQSGSRNTSNITQNAVTGENARCRTLWRQSIS